MAEQQAAPGQITAVQKAAMVISALGTENASSVFKFFTDEEIEKLTLEVAKMDYWPVEVVDEVLNDFYEICLTQKVISEGGVEYAREILEKAFGTQAANALFEKTQLKNILLSVVKPDYRLFQSYFIEPVSVIVVIAYLIHHIYGIARLGKHRFVQRNRVTDGLKRYYHVLTFCVYFFGYLLNGRLFRIVIGQFFSCLHSFVSEITH